MRAAILAGGILRGSARLRGRLRQADLLICANGGLRIARRLRLRPDVAIGDFDSASRALVSWARSAGAAIVPHPAAKDKTDAELALDHALARGAREVEFFGALGGRLDHLLANVGLLVNARARRCDLRLVDEGTEVLLAGRRSVVAARPGDLVSLLPLSGEVRGVSTRGLRYALRRATLRVGSSLGVSNVVVSAPVAVTVGSGDLLVIVTRRRPRRS